MASARAEALHAEALKILLLRSFHNIHQVSKVIERQRLATSLGKCSGAHHQVLKSVVDVEGISLAGNWNFAATTVQTLME